MTPADSGPIGDDERDVLLAPLAPFAVIVLAVSGGPDSTALLHLVHRWGQRQQRAADSLMAVTVDHGLRAESAAEAEAVARQARNLGIAHRTERWEGPAPATGLQAAARMARYRLLSAIAMEKAAGRGPTAIVTAHTADDQAETLIMRLARGSGVDGLASIPAYSNLPAVPPSGNDGAVALLRPLLSVPRARLLATLAANEITFADDPSNRDRRFERVRVREALDVLETLGLTRVALQRSVLRLQAAREVLEHAADDLEARAVKSIGGIVYEIDLAALRSAARESGVRVLRRVVAGAGGAAPPADLGAVEAALARVVDASDVPVFTLGGCIVDGARDKNMASGRVRVYREPDRDGGLPCVELAPGEAAIWDRRFRVSISEGYSGRVQVGPLGEDWQPILAEHPALMQLGLPRAAARGMAAFREAGTLLAVPALAALAAKMGEADAARRLAGPTAHRPDGVEEPVFLLRPLRPSRHRAE